MLTPIINEKAFPNLGSFFLLRNLAVHHVSTTFLPLSLQPIFQILQN